MKTIRIVSRFDEQNWRAQCQAGKRTVQPSGHNSFGRRIVRKQPCRPIEASLTGQIMVSVRQPGDWDIAVAGKKCKNLI
jgi:hypothetical protein